MRCHLFYLCVDSVGKGVLTSGCFPTERCRTEKNELSHSQGTLNSPWGLALAPANFGTFSQDLLVGNFGDGRINAFAPVSGAFLGQLQAQNGQAITINGLWGIAFGNGGLAGDTTTLFFASGLNDEADGLFGSITPD